MTRSERAKRLFKTWLRIIIYTPLLKYHYWKLDELTNEFKEFPSIYKYHYEKARYYYKKTFKDHNYEG